MNGERDKSFQEDPFAIFCQVNGIQEESELGQLLLTVADTCSGLSESLVKATVLTHHITLSRILALAQIQHPNILGREFSGGPIFRRETPDWSNQQQACVIDYINSIGVKELADKLCGIT